VGLLVLEIGDDLSKLVLDVGRVAGLVADTGESDGGLLDVTLVRPETGRLREEHETATKDEGPEELDTDGDAVRAGVEPVLSGVDDAVREQNTDGDGELVARHEGATDLGGNLSEGTITRRKSTNLLRGDLGHVQDDNGGNKSNTGTCNETTDDKAREDILGGELENATDGEDETANDDGRAAAENIGDITLMSVEVSESAFSEEEEKKTHSDKGTEESTGGQDRGHE
jgi:hypothetical protein